MNTTIEACQAVGKSWILCSLHMLKCFEEAVCTWLQGEAVDRARACEPRSGIITAVAPTQHMLVKSYIFAVMIESPSAEPKPQQ
jgi:hypothetical protein